MKQLISLWQKLQIARILTVFLVGFALLVTTACNSGDIRGARPDNPAVQAGGQNNPYKTGGDENTNYRMSPDPNVDAKAAKSQGDRAALRAASNQAVAVDEATTTAPDATTDASGLLYPGSDTTAPEDSAKRDPSSNFLERAGEAVKDSSAFLEDTLDSANKRPEMQANPAMHE